MTTMRGTNWLGTWNADAVVGATQEQLARGVGRAAQYLARRIKERISRPGVLKTQRFGASRLGGKRVARGTPGADIIRISRPGEPPRKRTGQLRASIRAEKVDAAGLLYRVGSHLKKARWLELGTVKMKPRPFLRTTLSAERLNMRVIMLASISGARLNVPRHTAPASSELTAEDVDRGSKNAFFQAPPAMGEL